MEPFGAKILTRNPWTNFRWSKLCKACRTVRSFRVEHPSLSIHIHRRSAVRSYPRLLPYVHGIQTKSGLTRPLCAISRSVTTWTCC
jgi:hypothetical protein